MYPSNITTIHIELTDKCQAACPMCSRNVFGGAERSHIKNTEITLAEFKQWFPREFLQQLDGMYACGNNGDPLLAHDCLEIFEYLVENTKEHCQLTIHTNASLRSKEWWQHLAEVMGKKGSVIFAIDGFKGEHEIYRRNTNWDKIIENAKTYIAAGGRAKADCLIFKHNEERIYELRDYLYSIGFEEVVLKPTQRFYGMDNYPVQDKDGNIEYYIQGPIKKEFSQKVMQPNVVNLVKPEVFRQLINNSKIAPKCQTGKDMYINTHGQVWPCCFVQALNIAEEIPAQDAEYVIRERLRQSAVDIAEDIKIPSLHGSNIIEVLASSGWAETLTKHYTDEKKFVCVKSCATNIRELVDGIDQPQVEYW